MFSNELIREINRVFHDVESEDYDERHSEILTDERDNWSNLAQLIFPLLRGKDRKKGLTIVDVGSGTGFKKIAFLSRPSNSTETIGHNQ